MLALAERTPVTDASISYCTTRAFERAMKSAFLGGGKSQKKHDKVRVVLGSLGESNPFRALPVTNHGESRLKNCVKYDLGDGWRLVTKQTDKACVFLYVGDHEDAEKWLNNHVGEDVGVKDRTLVRVPGVSIDGIPVRTRVAEQHDLPLVDGLNTDDIDYLLDTIPARVVRSISQLTGISTPESIDDCLSLIRDEDRRVLVRSVLVHILQGNIDGAKAHVDLSRGELRPISEFNNREILKINDGDEVRLIRVGSPDYEKWLLEFQRNSPWYDWFLFLHPEQDKVVYANYEDAAQLSGVSGSGKTCVVVRRAIGLAELNDARVLVLTLNRSLAGLLRKLVEAACTDEGTRNRIVISPFFDVCRGLLATFEPENARQYEEITWKLAEHVDEVFREYYRQWVNNNDASVLRPIHESLNARSVNGELYIREEFDWIRSAVSPSSRPNYLGIERKGRKFPIATDWRRHLLQGLHKWESKMKNIGVIDYLGITWALTKHIGRIGIEYTNILSTKRKISVRPS
jgi:hypothetical protein